MDPKNTSAHDTHNMINVHVVFHNRVMTFTNNGRKKIDGTWEKGEYNTCRLYTYILTYSAHSPFMNVFFPDSFW